MKNADLRLFFSESPFLRIVVFFILGIIIQDILNFSIIFTLILFCSSLVVAFLCSKINIYYHFKYKIINGLALLLIISTCGCFVHEVNRFSKKDNLKGFIQNDSTYFLIGKTSDPITENIKTIKTSLIVEGVYQNQKIKKVNGKVLIYFIKKNIGYNFDNNKDYSIIIKKKLTEIIHTNNPGSFNFKNYCNKKGIYHQVFLNNSDFIVFDSCKKTVLEKFLIKTQDFVLNTIKKHIKNKVEYGIIEALVIGYKADINKDIFNEYINSGVIHVIAISGLHLGFIYWLISGIILKKLNKNRRQRIIKFVICVFTLWFYSTISGNSPSILRAAIMFSFIALGDLINKKQTLYNLLSISAFFILICNTYNLFDTGFILSYCAIIGLLIFNKPISKLYITKNLVIKFVLNIIYSTIAAQIILFPILTISCHSFCTYFIVNNLIAIPLSTLILLLSLAIIIMSPLAIVANLLGIVTYHFTSFLNKFLTLSNSLKFSQINLSNFDYTQFILYIALIIMFVCIIKFKSQHTRHIWILVLFTTLIISSYNLFKTHKHKGQEQLVLYNANENVVEVVHGSKSKVYITGNKINSNTKKTLSYSNRFFGIKNVDENIIKSNVALKCKNKSIIYLLNWPFKDIVFSKINCDYVILNKCVLDNFISIKNSFSCKIYILDNSVSDYEYEKIKKHFECNFHYVKKDGAFIL